MSEHDYLDETLDQLSLLAPVDAPSAENALSRLKQHNSPRRSFVMSKRRLSAVGVVALLAVIALFTLPSARVAASNFLGLFRVQKFAPISISPDQIEVLAELAEGGLYPGEFEMLSEPEQYEEYDSFATAVSNLDSRSQERWLAVTAPELGKPTHIGIENGGVAQLTVDLEGARAIMEAVEIDPLLLPDSLDGAEVTAAVSDALIQQWDTIGLIQMPTPELAYPKDVDPAVIGEALLRFLGMDDAEAHRLARSIDWTNTLLMPIPTEFATFAEVQVNGTNGLAIESVDGQAATILWEQHNMVVMLGGEGVTVDELLKIADNLE